MPNPAARRPRPYAFIFQLGNGARVGKKKLPAALTSSLCFFYRSEHEPLAAKLDAIPDGVVSEADARLMFAAVDATIADNDLREELYSDDELAADRPRTEKSGFHAGGTFDACREALVRGGFIVEHLLDPHGLDEIDLTRTQELDEVLRALGRHLDLTSLALILGAASRRGELSWHAGSAADLLVDTIEGGEAPALVKRVVTAAARWPPEVRDALIVLAAYVASESQGETSAQLRELVAALGAPSDPVAAKWLLEAGAPAPDARATRAPVTARDARPAKALDARPAKPAPRKPGARPLARSRR